MRGGTQDGERVAFRRGVNCWDTQAGRGRLRIFLGTLKNSNVMLNSFQHPCAVIRTRDGARVTSDRAWILKRVQDDDVEMFANFATIS
jgi:hypothetical protein